MFLVQNLLGIRNVNHILGIDSPRQGKQRLQIRQLHIIVGRLRVDAFQFGQFAVENLLHLRFPELFLALFLEFLDFAVLSVAQFVLNVLDLLLQEILLLLAVQVFAGTHLDVLLQRSQLDSFVEQLNQTVQSGFQVVHLQQLILLVDWEREVARDEIHQHLVVVQVFQGEGRVGRNVVRKVDYFFAQLLARIYQRLELIRLFFLHILLNQGYFSFQEGTSACNLLQFDFGSGGLKYGRNIASGHFEYTEHLPDNPDGEQVFLLGRFYFTYFLRSDYN